MTRSSKLVEQTQKFVEEKFQGEGTGHDWWHMYRVWQLARHIASKEKDADLLIVELAALLHDIADWKFHDGDLEAGPQAARQWLQNIHTEERTIIAIEEIIRTVSFKGAGVASNMKTLEGKIVHDADKLDAMGAIGIARAFAYGGSKKRALYDPNSHATQHQTFEEYRKSDSSTINHFYEKLLLIKERMYTKTAQKMAEHRHTYMEDFLQEFYQEWDGKA